MPLQSSDDLAKTISQIDGRGYKAYKDLRGEYNFKLFNLHIDHVQADPFAPPSRIRITLNLERCGYKEEACESKPRRVALEDFLGRLLEQSVRGESRFGFRVDHHGQQVLKRTVVQLGPSILEARMGVELPAAGRRILGAQAHRLLIQDLPLLVTRTLYKSSIDTQALRRHQDTVEDHAALTAFLMEKDLVTFIANGASLARRAGHDDRPLTADGASPVVLFESPESMCVEVNLPHAGLIKGMGIAEGVTLLVGGGFHGKSTLLSAIALGIYPHIPGDGRERVATIPTAVRIRAEEGRAVTGTDISPFIDGLPFGVSTGAFTTQNASGSTSQAANIIEMLEAGARLLLIDEDSSATNFMIRDELMRRLLRPGQEPITPFLERVRDLRQTLGVSTVLVIGGSGEYFRVADRVIFMDHYRPKDVTKECRDIVSRIDQSAGTTPATTPITPVFGKKIAFTKERTRRLSVSGYGKGPRIKIKAVGTRRLVVDHEEVELDSCEQLVSPAQVRTLAESLTRLLEGEGRDLPSLSRCFEISEVLERWSEVIEQKGLDGICRFRRPDLAIIRPLELAAMLNRLRRLESD